jgi:hypothetical protein
MHAERQRDFAAMMQVVLQGSQKTVIANELSIFPGVEGREGPVYICKISTWLTDQQSNTNQQISFRNC